MMEERPARRRSMIFSFLLNQLALFWLSLQFCAECQRQRHSTDPTERRG
jgi:hypothetical protein